LFVVVNHFQPAGHSWRFGEVMGYLAALFAIAAALNNMTRGAAKRRRPRGGTEEIRGLTPLPDVVGQETRTEPPRSGPEQPDAPVRPRIAVHPL
jgi:hypothetical protein